MTIGRQTQATTPPSTSKARLYTWRATFQWAGTPVVGETADLYIAESDGLDVDGGVGLVDAAVTDLDKLKNLKYIGSIIIESVTISLDVTGSGLFTLNSRFGSLVIHNAATDALRTDTTVHGVEITPAPDEAQ